LKEKTENTGDGAVVDHGVMAKQKQN